MQAYKSFIFSIFCLFFIQIYSEEDLHVTPTLILKLHEQLRNLDCKMGVPLVDYERQGDNFFDSSVDTDLWNYAIGELADNDFNKQLLDEAYESYSLSKSLQNVDICAARLNLYKTCLIIRTLWDEKYGSPVKNLQDRVEETEKKIISSQNEIIREIFENEQLQNKRFIVSFFRNNKKDKKSKDKDFENNPTISGKERKIVRPYLIPANHPLKPTLDEIFKTRVTASMESLTAAGFSTKDGERPRSYIVVASHPKLPGYLIKAHLDCQKKRKKHEDNWVWLARRVKGVNKIHKELKKEKITHFTAPKKWMYHLPIASLPIKEGAKRNNYILVVEDMNLVPFEENLNAWKNKITKQHLKELYKIMIHAKGSSYRADNIAYTKEGKFAFIDTEYPHKKPNFTLISPYLNHDMRMYWDKLVN